MRILYFTRDYTTHDHRFLTALAKTEHKVAYLRLERGEHPMEDRPLPTEIELVLWKGGRKPVSLRDGPALLLNLKQVIRQIKPDLVLAGPLQRTALLTALAGFRPLVSMSWGYDLIQDAGRNFLWRWATRYTLKRSAVMVGDCETVRQLARSHGMPNERIVTFPWGIDLEHFSPLTSEKPGALGSRNHPFTLLSTRSWEPVYGVDVIARAFVKAAQQMPELRLVMLGNGSQAPELRKIFSRAGLLSEEDSRVLFPGTVSYAELPRYYRSANLYVAATHSDGTSISLLEALACGLPALVSDIPGNREWVTSGEQGWLFPEGDAQALAQAILEAASQRARLVKMGDKARQLAQKRADWNKNFGQLLHALTLALIT